MPFVCRFHEYFVFIVCFRNVLTCYKPFEEFWFFFTFTSEHFRLSILINHVTLCIKVKKKYSEWIWRFDAREGKKVKYIFANTTAQREKKLNPHANTPSAVKLNEINPKYENTRKIHRLLTNQNPGFLYKV
jgi:hypothetical protein